MANHSKGRRPELIEQSRATALKRGAPWTEDEDDILRSFSSQQDELLAAARAVHRTLGAVIVRYYKVRVADRQGTLIRYANRSNNHYPDGKQRYRIFTAPACACADPWDHREWCPDKVPTSTEGDSNVTVLNQAYTQSSAASPRAA